MWTAWYLTKEPTRNDDLFGEILVSCRVPSFLIKNISHMNRPLSIKFTVQKDVTSPDSANRYETFKWNCHPHLQGRTVSYREVGNPKGMFLVTENYRSMTIVSNNATAIRQWLIPVQQSTKCPQLTHKPLGMFYINNIISKPVMWFPFATRFIASTSRSHKVCVVSAPCRKSGTPPYITPIHLVNKLKKQSGKSDVKIYIILYIV